jgi:hypothetical protein
MVEMVEMVVERLLLVVEEVVLEQLEPTLLQLASLVVMQMVEMVGMG